MAKRKNSKKSSKKPKFSFTKTKLIVFLIISCILCSTFLFYKPLEIWINNLLYPQVSADVDGCELKVHFIDIGQGDSILVELPDNKLMLVDAGPNSGEKNLLLYLNNFFEKRDNKKIDYFIVTHQDEDHIGGADIVFDNYEVLSFHRPTVYTPDEMTKYGYSTSEVNVCDTKVFKTMISKMEAEGCKVVFNAQSNNPLGLTGTEDYTVEFLSPKRIKYNAPNDYSPITIITYQNRKVMLTGDAETLVENEVLDDYSNDYLNCDILKLGHHGSSTSTSQNFLDAVSPKYVAISCGVNNKYHHPNETVYARVVEKIGENNIYRTDTMGNITFGIDKDSVVGGKAEIKIAHAKGQVVQLYVEWWYIIVCLESLLFVIVFVPNYGKFTNN